MGKKKTKNKMTDGCHSLTCLNQPVVTNSDVTKLKTQLHKKSTKRTSKKQQGAERRSKLKTDTEYTERASDTVVRAAWQ